MATRLHGRLMRKAVMAGWLLLSGCASMVVDKQQTLTVTTMPPHAACSASNDKGTWALTSPAPSQITVLRSIEPLAVTCQEAGYQDTVIRVYPQINQLASFAGGGLIGLSIDKSTGALADYPSLITVILPPLH